MTKHQTALWNRAIETVVRRLRRNWDDNGPWSKWVAEMAAGKARSAKIRACRPSKR